MARMVTTTKNQTALSALPVAASRLVYSTEVGRVCPACSKPQAQCSCKLDAAVVPATDGTVRVSLETKGRKGKGVTVIKGVPLGDKELALLGKQLRSACGSGGTTKDGIIEIQGDHCVSVILTLEKLQFSVKRVGG